MQVDFIHYHCLESSSARRLLYAAKFKLFLVNTYTLIIVFPSGQHVSIPGGSAEFSCVVLVQAGVVNLQWLLNGTLLDDPRLVNATVENLDNMRHGRLIFTDLPYELNVTRIRCRAVYSDGEEEDSVDSALLLLQGDDLHAIIIAMLI